MSKYAIEDYSFDSLRGGNRGDKIETLAYLIGLVDSSSNSAGDLDTAQFRILLPLSEVESYAECASDLLKLQAGFLPENYFPLTPVMFVKRWSPISFMLQRGFEPCVLNLKTDGGPHAVATGIWAPAALAHTVRLEDCASDEELCMALINEAFNRARSRGWYVNVIAQVGWKYESQVGRLQMFSEREVSKSGRILWKSTIAG